VRENYIDNGSPYWATLGMQMYSIPAADPFWTAPEEPLPVERADYVKRFDGPRMLVVGTQASGQVRWVQARNTPKFLRYRDSYCKLVASSHFPPNRLKDEDRCAWDQELVFRDRATGAEVTRVGVVDGELTDDGVRTHWWTEVAGRRIEVETSIRLLGEFEHRTHRLVSPEALAGLDVEVLEGSHALGLAHGETAEVRSGDGWRYLRSPRSGRVVASWRLAGYDALDTVSHFRGKAAQGESVNLVYPRMAVNTLHGRAGATEFSSLHYASPKPLPLERLLREGPLLTRGS
jgi:hypothetical protein